MDVRRPRGPEEQGMVPQGPEDAEEDGDRGAQRRQVTIRLAVNWGIGKLYNRGETLVMKSKRMFVC